MDLIIYPWLYLQFFSHFMYHTVHNTLTSHGKIHKIIIKNWLPFVNNHWKRHIRWQGNVSKGHFKENFKVTFPVLCVARCHTSCDLFQSPLNRCRGNRGTEGTTVVGHCITRIWFNCLKTISYNWLFLATNCLTEVTPTNLISNIESINRHCFSGKLAKRQRDRGKNSFAGKISPKSVLNTLKNNRSETATSWVGAHARDICIALSDTNLFA